jgi:bile acid:Na+ symporter, BASS family
MDLRQAVILALQVSVICIVLGFGLRTTLDDFRYLFQRPGLLFRSLLAMLVIMPIVAVLLARTFNLHTAAEIALIALAISPVPPLLPKRESGAVGHHPYGLALMAVLAAVGIVTIPLSGEILARVYGRPFTAAPATIARIALVMVLLPLAAGMLVRELLPSAVERIARVVTMVAKILLPLGALLLLAGTWRMILGAIGGGTVVVMVMFVVIGLVVGDLFGRPVREHSVVLGLSTACRHPAIALSIAAANFPKEHFAGTILLYLLVNAIVGMLYLKWWQTTGDSVVVA